ncbi:uncharacterized protein BJ171DRAFT_485590 [Polychytrium aggregatum]|uniref:uncharacterized protein n=1 Tax=Polychytrium aggregatum TaxID=110093 RepID=UPI0022FE6082|nr:uncharacterized protein BJ171DRAFT_485590 [Polychytrium aggregatum]KAI9209927.1 hypothetical protein BJ171DRAFT_485590 [Polychytrium aggregatum]
MATQRKRTGQGSQPSTTPTAEPQHECRFAETMQDGCVKINLLVKPGARISQIMDASEECVDLQIAAPPRDGEANAEVVRYVAEVLGCKRYQLELLSGAKSRSKVVRVQDLALAQVIERIQAHVR